MAIITLTTDWQSDDFYVGAIKGHIFSQCPGVNIVDVTHRVQSYDSAYAAFILRGTFPHFPAGTIHLLCTNSEISEESLPMCICYKGQFFLGIDPKALKVLFNERPEKVFVLNPEKFTISTFPELTILAEAACMLANGVPPENFGFDNTDDFSILNIGPSRTGNILSGHVIYIDSYKNLITDITKEQFHAFCGDRPFEIVVKNDIYKITRISNTYNEVQAGSLLAIFNSLGLLEIAMNKAFVATLADVKPHTAVMIKIR